MQPSYAELHCISNFSFLRGASHPEELVDRAHTLGYTALALTDECSMAGIVRAHLQAKQCEMKLIAGAEFVVDTDLVDSDAPPRKIALLAQNRNGYGNLCELISLARSRTKKGTYQLLASDLGPDAAYAGDCLALLIGNATTTFEDARWLRAACPDRTWLAVELLRGPDDTALLDHLTAIGAAAGVPLVAAGGIMFHDRDRKPLHDVLTAIRLKIPLTEAAGDVLPNSEPHLRGIGRIANLYRDELLFETLNVAARCTFNLDELRYEYPEEIVPTGETPAAYLRRMTYEGAARRGARVRPLARSARPAVEDDRLVGRRDGAAPAADRGRLRSAQRSVEESARDGRRADRLPAPLVAAHRRVRHRVGQADAARAGRERDDAGAHRDPVGQGRSGCDGIAEGRRARARNADGDPENDRGGE
jgi:DNA polymerase III alpha subunit